MPPLWLEEVTNFLLENRLCGLKECRKIATFPWICTSTGASHQGKVWGYHWWPFPDEEVFDAAGACRAGRFVKKKTSFISYLARILWKWHLFTSCTSCKTLLVPPWKEVCSHQALVICPGKPSWWFKRVGILFWVPVCVFSWKTALVVLKVNHCVDVSF